jgi:C4-type Zn-finger protein
MSDSELAATPGYPRLACPSCNCQVRWRNREEQDDFLSTVYAYLECTGCGMRSREVVSLKPQRSMIAKEWTDNKEISEHE